MQILCDLGYTSTAIGELMSSLISSKGSCFVPGKYPTTREAARAMRAGVIAVLAGAFERPGPITLRAESDGLEPGTLTVEIQ